MERYYSLFDQGYALSVTEVSTGATFHLQGDDANQFRDEWNDAPLDMSFDKFLSLMGYDELLTIH